MRKRYLFLLALSILSILSIGHAKTITIEVDDSFTEKTKFVQNFDGSIGVLNPELMINGQARRVIHSSLVAGDFLNSINGICALVNGGRALASKYEVIRGLEAVILNKDGSVEEFVETGVVYLPVSEVICK